MTRRFSQLFVGSNLKMYKTNQQTAEYINQLQTLTRDLPRPPLQLFILPSYTALADACRLADPDLLWVGAQNMHWEEEGPYTGEVSVAMLKDIGVNLVMVGHVERRQHFGETDEMVNRRILTALRNNLNVLVCIGETLAQKQAGKSKEVLRTQLVSGLNEVPSDQLDRLWVAYEPVWSVGVYGTPSAPDFANAMHAVIRQTLAEIFPSNYRKIPVLYGGSVNLENTADLISMPEMDGLFIGRHAWEAENFNRILRIIFQKLEERSG